jgi:hypothetical protein
MHVRYVVAELVSTLIYPSCVLYLQSCRCGSVLNYRNNKIGVGAKSSLLGNAVLYLLDTWHSNVIRHSETGRGGMQRARRIFE